MVVRAQFKPWYNLPILGPYAVAVTTLTTVAATVLAADPTRAGVIFHNPGAQNKRVLPVGGTLIGGAGGILIYPQSEFTLLQDELEQYNVNCAWQAVTDNNADGALTILDFTPATPGAPEVLPTTRKQQQIPVTSPIASTTATLGVGSTRILSADPNRHGVQFHNPGTVTIAVCPDNVAASIGAGSIILLPGQTKTIIGNDHVRVNAGWLAAAASGAANALTALSLYG